VINRIFALLAIAVAFAFATEAQAQTAPPANTATISFTAPTKRVDGSTPTGAITYSVYQGVKGQSKTKVGTLTTTTGQITTGLLGGGEYCWQVTAQEAGGPESALSNEACKAFPLSPLTTVTITVQ